MVRNIDPFGMSEIGYEELGLQIESPVKNLPITMCTKKFAFRVAHPQGDIPVDKCNLFTGRPEDAGKSDDCPILCMLAGFPRNEYDEKTEMYSARALDVINRAEVVKTLNQICRICPNRGR